MHLQEAPEIKAERSFSWEDDKQLQQLLEKFDLTCAMKSSPSRSKRLKLLKKTINDVRNEMSLKRVLPSTTITIITTITTTLLPPPQPPPHQRHQPPPTQS
ncbi:hypothetical protein F7725_021915 [Dissostichus mawsoni]|uniref:Uncharacterized protein n=1 Tax=Dissostichus mawsoni TaxID=36200 RepID=A0A7J5ZD06_DISMA|nr:hypothetical protein F7725_021915 [Dissostichus mawsoni]